MTSLYINVFDKQWIECINISRQKSELFLKLCLNSRGVISCRLEISSHQFFSMKGGFSPTTYPEPMA